MPTAKSLAAAASALAAIGATAVTAPASARQGELAGTWTSIDSDGSNQTLRIRGAGHPVYAMFLTDDFTSGACGGPPAQVAGAGRLVGTELTMRGPLVCRPGGNRIRERISIVFEYDAAGDSLTDSFGVVWERAG